ncbi:hypothetical protein [Mesorhizobium kowhaii]|uniref:Uncharacterized protein n=1 Tax=Mesorhizobium kowhaii TaxID=1300272 RepID=A0A2W7BYJ8_9HYPH|nr:hypothetical protein [Mesorhizobium kowhaii]PZV35862.1 hypothetical protein B5V02_24875 [Mesorhizobium kowhaii]PZV36310.1 hypothetical protein B5V02_24350 [Mesorhizobium kowhaii]PZV39010.1 hypothetical protein B5V02_02935 [Mesorhizobium kowhaii]
MRELPRNIDADVVLAIGRMLDDHAKLASVSLADSVLQIRKEHTTALTDLDIEELVIEMAASRGLAVLLDRTAK